MLTRLTGDFDSSLKLVDAHFPARDDVAVFGLAQTWRGIWTLLECRIHRPFFPPPYPYNPPQRAYEYRPCHAADSTAIGLSSRLF